MTESRTIEIAILRRTFREQDLLTADELARRTAISSATLERLIRHGVVEPDAPSNRFTAAAAARLEHMLRLRHDLEVGLRGASIIVDLLERLDRLEADLHRLRRERLGGDQRGGT